MRVSHVLRKPLNGPVAQNVRDYGCGAIHTDATRIRVAGETIRTHSRSPEASAKKNRPIYGEYGPQETHQTTGQKLGRWPSNLILGSGPVAVDLDIQSGVSVSAGGRVGNKDGTHIYGGWHGLTGDWVAGGPGFGHTGGASRYYKQVGNMSDAAIPKDLLDYLYALISPTHLDDCMVLYVPDFKQFDWDERGDASLHGMIAVTPPEGLEVWKDKIWRVLKPGAHLLLISPEDEPTGHTGACMMEDRGFEVRDAILVAQEVGCLHYVSKASQKERHAGCETLKLRRKQLSDQETDNMNGAAGPDVVAHPSQNMHKGNIHPTCKPKAVMIRLLSDVPQEATVLDPFMGSGTTGLACLETGHNFIGVEREEPYLEIADARVHHWDRMRAGWQGADIESEAPAPFKEAPEEDLLDFLDL